MEKVLASLTVRTFFLLALELASIPLTALIVIPSYILTCILPRAYIEHERWCARRKPGFREYTVLVTGVSMAKGLTLARAFYLCGHRVIGADFTETGVPCSGQYSRALSNFYRLGNSLSRPRDYTERLLQIVQQENVHLWVSCSGVTSALDDALAMEIIEKKTSCRCIQFDKTVTTMLHEKDLFMRHCRQIQLPIPETYSVESADQTLEILQVAAASNPNHRFILKTVGVDDAHRGDMSLLPLGSDEETARHVTRLPISRHNPWILQRYIAGNEEFCTHAVVMKGDVKVFVACQSAELLMHYRALPAEDDMTRTMLHFTREFLKRSPGVEDWTGHLSFDFMAEKVATGNGQTRRLYAIECNPRAHTAVVLFAQRGREMRDMVQAYLSALDGETFPKTNGISDAPIPESNSLSAVYPPADALPRYWIGHDLVTLWLLPTYKLLIREQEPSKYLRVVLELLKHVLWWKDGTFEIWDPLPFMHLYHTYWAGTLWNAWMQGINWSRLNVSTTKIFLCD